MILGRRDASAMRTAGFPPAKSGYSFPKNCIMNANNEAVVKKKLFTWKSSGNGFSGF